MDGIFKLSKAGAPILGALLCAAAALQTVSAEDTQTAGQSLYPLLTVQKGSLTFEREIAATVKGISDIDIYPQVSGKISSLYVQEGMPVKKDQVLFVIDQVPYQAAYDKAAANVEAAEATLATAKLLMDSRASLLKSKSVSNYDYQSAVNAYKADLASLNIAKAELLSAEDELSKTEIRCPVSGVLGMTSVREGTLVSSNMSEPLVTVSDNASVRAYFSLSESSMLYIMKLAGGFKEKPEQSARVKFRLSDGTMFPEEGEVDALSGIADTTTGAFLGRATFPNPDRLLHSGSTGTVVFPITINDALIIPQTATYELQNKTFVYKVVDGKAKAAIVELMNVNDGTNYVVTSGIEEGDVIVSDGVGLLKEGTEIYGK